MRMVTMTLPGLLCVLAYAWWVTRIILIRPWKVSRPRPVYRIKDGKIFHA
jgi:hypothetical protein